MLWKVLLTDIVLWNSSLAWGFHTVVKKKTQIYTFPLLNMSAWDYAWFSEWKQNREWPCRPKPSTAFKFGWERLFPGCMNAMACVQRSFRSVWIYGCYGSRSHFIHAKPSCTFFFSFFLPVKYWALSEHCRSCSDVYFKGGHSQCPGCY